MNISGVLVLAKPEFTKSITNTLNQIQGVEVHAVSDKGRMVVTIEMEDMKNTVDCVTKLQYIDGVLSASMIYNHFDDADDSVANELLDRKQAPFSTNNEEEIIK